MERMTKVDENIQTAQNMLSGIVERCYELEEENKKLEEEVKDLVERNIELDKKYMLVLKTIKDHQFYEERLEHRIIELEELLHGE